MEDINKTIINLAINNIKEKSKDLKERLNIASNKREELATKYNNHKLETLSILSKITDHIEYEYTQKQRFKELNRINEGYKIAEKVFIYFGKAYYKTIKS